MYHCFSQQLVAVNITAKILRIIFDNINSVNSDSSRPDRNKQPADCEQRQQTFRAPEHLWVNLNMTKNTQKAWELTKELTLKTDTDSFCCFFMLKKEGALLFQLSHGNWRCQTRCFGPWKMTKLVVIKWIFSISSQFTHYFMIKKTNHSPCRLLHLKWNKACFGLDCSWLFTFRFFLFDIFIYSSNTIKVIF